MPITDKEVHVIGFGWAGPFVPHQESFALDRLIADEVIFRRPQVPETTQLHLFKKPKTADMTKTDAVFGIEALIDQLVAGPKPKVVFLTVDLYTATGEPLASKIRKTRKDIFLVSVLNTYDEDHDAMFMNGLSFLKETSSNLVIVRGRPSTGQFMIVTPEQARYCVTTSKEMLAHKVVHMALFRAGGQFTRTTVVDGPIVPIQSDRVPPNFREVVGFLVDRGAYKDILKTDKTVGHFAVKIDDSTMLTTRRGTNFNRIFDVGDGLIEVRKQDPIRPTHLTAFGPPGTKPSVGGASQRVVFYDHPGYDCIVHAHIPLKDYAPDMAKIMVQPQWLNECGSTECGKATSDGLRDVGEGIRAVYLSHHGPNIVFRRDTPAQDVCDFIERNFDLSRHTGETPQW